MSRLGALLAVFNAMVDCAKARLGELVSRRTSGNRWPVYLLTILETHSTNTKLLRHAIRSGPSDGLTDGLPAATHIARTHARTLTQLRTQSW